MQFAEEPEKKPDPFGEYFEETIVPLVKEENKIKDKYRSRFWGFLFSMLFLMSANVLIVLFNAEMHHTPISKEQLFLITAIAFALIFYPIYQYKRIPKDDIFAVFLKFYGNWKLSHNSGVQLVHSPVIPAHDNVAAAHDITCDYGNVRVELRDTFYTSKFIFKNLSRDRTVSSGVVLYVTFPFKFGGKLLMFDRGGFYRKKKYTDYEYYNGKTDIPSANYFNIFFSDDKFGEQMLHSLFLENLLDLKDAFGASHIYLQAEDNYTRVYMENSRLYIDSYKFWSKRIDKDRFLRLHNAFEKTYIFVQTVQALAEKQ